MFWFNWLIIVFTAVFGFGMGGYASIKASGSAGTGSIMQAAPSVQRRSGGQCW